MITHRVSVAVVGSAVTAVGDSYTAAWYAVVAGTVAGVGETVEATTAATEVTTLVAGIGVTSLAVVTVTSPMSGASRCRRRSDLSTFAYSSSTGDMSDKSLSELHGSVIESICELTFVANMVLILGHSKSLLITIN